MLKRFSNGSGRGWRWPWYPALLSCHATTRRFCSTLAAAPSELIVGDAQVGVRDSAAYAYTSAEFIGKMIPLVRPRTDAGDILSILDMAASRCTFFFVHQYKGSGPLGPVDGGAMATISINSFLIHKAVYEGDLIIVDSQVIHAGKASLGVFLEVKRQSYDCPIPSKIGDCYVTMVTIDASNLGVLRHGVAPAVRLTTQKEIAHNKRYHKIRKETTLDEAQRVAQLARTLTVEEVELPHNKRKKVKVAPKDTEVTGDRCFGVEDVNSNHVIFGGNILKFMECTALHCGRTFAEKPNLFTFGMLGVTFESPISMYDLVQCTAKVMCVRRSTMLVEVRITAERDGKVRSTNKASFLLVCVDITGATIEIDKGLDLSQASQEELHEYLNARYMIDAAKKRNHS